MSSIIGKFLNWCLTPLYTYLLVPAEYGIVVYLYAWIGTMLVLLTYGLETGFFRYANDSSKGDPQTVYSTCMTSLGITTCLFLILVFSFLSPISGALQYGQHQDYIGIDRNNHRPGCFQCPSLCLFACYPLTSPSFCFPEIY